MRTIAAPQPKAWTAAAVRQLGMTTDVETAAAILGIGRTKAYELAKSGEFPVKVLRIGRLFSARCLGTTMFTTFGTSGSAIVD